jgi:hypothetical protein
MYDHKVEKIKKNGVVKKRNPYVVPMRGRKAGPIEDDATKDEYRRPSRHELDKMIEREIEEELKELEGYYEDDGRISEYEYVGDDNY